MWLFPALCSTSKQFRIFNGATKRTTDRAAVSIKAAGSIMAAMLTGGGYENTENTIICADFRREEIWLIRSQNLNLPA